MPETYLPKPVALLILDGWGLSENPEHNAIHSANTPNWDRLLAQGTLAKIDTSGMAVGLPDGQMGNSEVGHLNMGAGRIVPQDYTRITQAIEDGSIAENPQLNAAIDVAIANDGAVHLLGLLSPGGVHSHEDHLQALARIAAKRGATKVYCHAFLDGRDMPPRSAAPSVQAMDDLLRELNVGRVASLVGRYYAMDRDQRWDRVQQAWDLLTLGQSEYQADTAIAGLEAAYARDENDEFVKTTTVAGDGETAVTINDGDAVLFLNYRSDRARELTRPFIEAEFDDFARSATPRTEFVSLTQYQAEFDCPVAFAPVELKNSLGEFLSDQGKRQLRIAETEKYAHVTFFFNGGEETPFAGEDRDLVPSPKVATYDLQPEMNAPEVTRRLCEHIRAGSYDAIICNFANPDMVGHSGIFDAAVKAVEAVDTAIGAVADALAEVGGELLITADHGNVEQMYNPDTSQAHTAHTTNPVPLLYIGRPASLVDGALCDIAPSLLTVMGLQPPAEMTGRNLIEFNAATDLAA